MLLPGRRLVDHHLAGLRPASVDEGQRVEGRPAVGDAEAEIRGAAEDDPFRTSVKIELKALSIESVRTNVPETIATPRMIAIAVSDARSFRPSRPLSATLIT
jgi:hypothetical protein